MYARYALFYTPAAGPLDEAGARWLGWCSRRRQSFEPLGLRVEKPAKYGLHGTLVAPFGLVEDVSEAEVIETALDVAHAHAPVVLKDGLSLSCQHGFFALRPTGDAASLEDLAARCVRAIRPLRRIPDDAELARRLRANLSARQAANLVRWGYPYVMQDFDFHITLTSRVKRDQNAVETRLRRHLAHIALAPYSIDAITVMGERHDGQFVQISRLPLGDSSASISPGK